jgi:hypothetical protein
MNWQSMDDAPKGRTVRVKLKSGEILVAHFAQDLSGEAQPPFKGWFKQRSKTHPEYGYVQIDDPIGWKPIEAAQKRKRENGTVSN